MQVWLVKILFAFIKTETAKEVAKLATKKVVESTDSSIDDELAKVLLGDISKSTGNKIKDTMLKEAYEVLNGNK